MRKYIIALLILILMVIVGVGQVQSQTNTLETKNKSIDKRQTTIYTKQRPINPDILKVQKITDWNLEISRYFVEEANARGVKIFEEALPLASKETGGTYDFGAEHVNSDGSVDGGLFQLNDITYLGIMKQLKLEGREFKSWDRKDPYFNISAGIYWIAFLKDNHQLENHALFSSYNMGVEGAKRFASRHRTYESEYSKEVFEIRNDMKNK